MIYRKSSYRLESNGMCWVNNEYENVLHSFFQQASTFVLVFLCGTNRQEALRGHSTINHRWKNSIHINSSEAQCLGYQRIHYSQCLLVPSNTVACFRMGLVWKKFPEFSWFHCGRLHLVIHVTIRDHTMACNFFFVLYKVFKWRFECPNEVPVSPKSVSVLRVWLLLLLLAINAINALWHPHTPVLSTDERKIGAVKIVRSSCQRCITWIFRIKISSIVWEETY